MSLHKTLRTQGSFLEKQETLKDTFLGEECLVLSCGPSLKHLSKDKIREFARGKRVACIKQAQIGFSDITDFHFINDNNVLKYDRREETLIFGSSGGLDEKTYSTFTDKQPDLFFQIDTSFGTTAGDCNFKDFEFSKKRRWGPGIMYETVLPSLLHMGFKTLYVVGWDYTTSPDGTLKHFYDETAAKKVLKNTGAKIGQMFAGEKEQLVSSTGELQEYLKNRNVKMYLISEVSELSQKLERMTI